MRRIVVLIALVVGVLAATPARATCQPGRVGYDKETKKIYLELPECHPYE